MTLLFLTFWIFLSLKYPWRTWKPHCLVFRNSNYIARACACFVSGQGKCFPELGALSSLGHYCGEPLHDSEEQQDPHGLHGPVSAAAQSPANSRMLISTVVGWREHWSSFKCVTPVWGREWSFFGAVDLSWIVWASSVPQCLLSLSELGTQCCISSPGEGGGLPGLHDNICCKWRKQS